MLTEDIHGLMPMVSLTTVPGTHPDPPTATVTAVDMPTVERMEMEMGRQIGNFPTDRALLQMPSAAPVEEEWYHP
jgi:hypothetical protein